MRKGLRPTQGVIKTTREKAPHTHSITEGAAISISISILFGLKALVTAP